MISARSILFDLDGTLIDPKLGIIKSIDPADALMVGDREHDILSAKKCMVRSVAVTYGYGSKDELSAARPDYVFETLGDLADSLVDLR